MDGRDCTRIAATAFSLVLLSGCSSSGHGTLTGVVRGYGGFGATGQPMPRQDFDIEDESGNRVTLESDDEGNFTASLTPGKYTMRCGSGGHEFTVEAQQTVALDCDYQMA